MPPAALAILRKNQSVESLKGTRAFCVQSLDAASRGLDLCWRCLVHRGICAPVLERTRASAARPNRPHSRAARGEGEFRHASPLLHRATLEADCAPRNAKTLERLVR